MMKVSTNWASMMGRAHFQDGLIFEKDAAFGQGLDLAGEAEILQEIQEAALKEAGGGEISQVCLP